MMRYRCQVIGEDDLPPPHDWALIIHNGVATVLVKRSALRRGVIGRAIADYEADIRQHLTVVA